MSTTRTYYVKFDSPFTLPGFDRDYPAEAMLCGSMRIYPERVSPSHLSDVFRE
jgi:hypothetical protein